MSYITQIKPKMHLKYSEGKAFKEFSAICFQQHKERHPQAKINVTAFNKVSSDKWKDMTQNQKKMFFTRIQNDEQKTPCKSTKLEKKTRPTRSSMANGISRDYALKLIEEDRDEDSGEEENNAFQSKNSDDCMARKRRSAALAVGSMTEPTLKAKMRRKQNKIHWQPTGTSKSTEEIDGKNKAAISTGDTKSTPEMQSKHEDTENSNDIAIKRVKDSLEKSRAITNRKLRTKKGSLKQTPDSKKRKLHNACEDCQMYSEIIRILARHLKAPNDSGKEIHSSDCDVCDYCRTTFIKFATHQKTKHESQWDILNHRKYGFPGKHKRKILTRFLQNINSDPSKRRFEALKIRTMKKIEFIKSRPTKHQSNEPINKSRDRSVTTEKGLSDDLNKLLNHLIISLQERDRDQIFYEPVTEDIAPGYFNMINEPMDLKTMSKKIHSSEYQTLEDFRSDFVLICKNAMAYNAYQSPIYMKASRFKKIGIDLMSDESVQYFNEKLSKVPNEKSVKKVLDRNQSPTLIGTDSLNSSKANKNANELKTTEKEMDSTLMTDAENQTPFNKLLLHLMSLLIAKDEDKIFAKPVTEEIAPGYFDLIKHPMDFSTMIKNVKNLKYSSYQDFISDFNQICRNAHLYNVSNSFFYKKASELKKFGDRILSKRSIRTLKEDLPYILDIPDQQLGFSVLSPPKELNAEIKTPISSKKNPSKQNSCSESKESNSMHENEPEELSEYEKLRLRNIAMRKQMMADVIQESIDVSQSIGSKKKKLLCMQCDYITDSSYKLEGHVNSIHENKTPYKCDECEYETAFEMNLSRHVKFEHFDRLFKCESCSMVTPSKIKLRIHADICARDNSQNSEDGNQNISTQASSIYDEILDANLPLNDEVCETENAISQASSTNDEMLNSNLPLNDEKVCKTQYDTQNFIAENDRNSEDNVKSILADWIDDMIA